MKVNQAVTLTQDYSATQVAQPQRSLCEGRICKVSEDGSSRVDRTKSTWDRFTSRNSHRLSQIADCFVSEDRTANREANRFNLRHEKFSAKVVNLVADLKAGQTHLLADPHYVATLRNDVKLMNRDMPWASRSSLLEKRMDVELSKLSGEELQQVKQSLRECDVSQLTTKDRADIETMKRCVVRQELSRCEALGEAMEQIGAPVGTIAQSRASLEASLNDSLFAVEQFSQGFTGPISDSDKLLMLHDATRLKLQKNPQDYPKDVLGTMNRNILTAQEDYRLFTEGTKKLGNPVIRAFSRAIRAEYLQVKTSHSFKDTNLQSRFNRLGAGAAHEVSKGLYLDAGPPPKEMAKVFKGDDETIRLKNNKVFCAPDHINVDHDDPRLLERAVFTSLVDEALGLNVSVKTDFALHHDHMGLVMDLAGGVTAGSHTGKVPMQDGQVKRDFMALQLLDYVTGQMDRHRGNFMLLDPNENSYGGLVAIDSDFCMGAGCPLPEDLVGEEGVHSAGYPPILDEEMVAKLRAFDQEKMAELADDMFSEQTMAAMSDRVENLLGLIDDGTIRVIGKGEWGSDGVNLQLESTIHTRDGKGQRVVPDGPQTYWGRDHDRLVNVNFSQLLLA